MRNMLHAKVSKDNFFLHFNYCLRGLHPNYCAFGLTFCEQKYIYD